VAYPVLAAAFMLTGGKPYYLAAGPGLRYEAQGGMRRWHARAVTNRSVSPVFVGREAEIETLAGALGEAAAGRPQVVLVGAEAGGGKSRLVSEYEHNLLFAAVLERLGYAFAGLSARVTMGTGKLRPPTHMCLRVEAVRTYLAWSSSRRQVIRLPGVSPVMSCSRLTESASPSGSAARVATMRNRRGSWISGLSAPLLMVGSASFYRPPSRSRSAWV
jgi:hypothetical protein